ncbi:hypothetical protein APS47_18995 [Leptospira kirschneri serovar Mozdok]|nr:hypothetical protein APS47_18995 [Leptospira kirschneri serovar Mozdok]
MEIQTVLLIATVEFFNHIFCLVYDFRSERGRFSILKMFEMISGIFSGKKPKKILIKSIV